MQLRDYLGTLPLINKRKLKLDLRTESRKYWDVMDS